MWLKQRECAASWTSLILMFFSLLIGDKFLIEIKYRFSSMTCGPFSSLFQSQVTYINSYMKIKVYDRSVGRVNLNQTINQTNNLF